MSPSFLIELVSARSGMNDPKTVTMILKKEGVS